MEGLLRGEKGKVDALQNEIERSKKQAAQDRFNNAIQASIEALPKNIFDSLWRIQVYKYNQKLKMELQLLLEIRIKT